MKRIYKIQNKCNELVWKYNETHKKTFSQSGEDTIVLFLLQHILQRDKISYLDLGANHPKLYSNTFLLRSRLKIEKGVLVEPNPDMCKLIKRHRKEDICLNIGIGKEGQKEELNYYMMDTNTLNTFSPESVKEYENRGHVLQKIVKIPVCDVNEIFKTHFKDIKVDFLSIDVEGYDLIILKSINFEQNKPLVICIETAEYLAGKGSDYAEIRDILEKAGYSIYADTFLNTIFVDKEILNNYIGNGK